jgi:hypothetical protein
MEKPKFGFFPNKCLTMVVLPEPDGAEKIIALPDDIFFI